MILDADIVKARLFAIAAHEAVGQKRKYSGFPYWYHCETVVNVVNKWTPGNTHNIVVAWLHDVLEDTQVSLATIQYEFGPDIAEDVLSLSDLLIPSDGNRAFRKRVYREKLKNSNANVQLVKLADIIANTLDIDEYTPSNFVKLYLSEAKETLKSLSRKEVDIFREIASTTVNSAERTWVRFD